MSATLPLAGSRRPSVRINFFPSALLISLLLPFFLLSGAFGQANVNESLETANVYVNGTTGSDSNPGTESKPLKTIGAAASMAESNNHASIGTKVTIEAGTYRESITMSHSSKDTSLPITIEASTNGTVIVSGAVLYTGWSEYSANKSIYTTSWTNDWGTCPQLSRAALSSRRLRCGRS